MTTPLCKITHSVKSIVGSVERRLLALVALLMLLSPSLVPASVAKSSDPKLTISDGLYLVVAADRAKKHLLPLQDNQIVVLNDFRLLEPLERETPIFLKLQKAPFVPLLINGKPLEDKEEGSNKPRLQLTLEDEQIEPLKQFTATNLGKTVAIVIGGEVVSTHKIRTAITGGRLQITRCTKHGCETLYTRLLKKRD